MAKRKQSQTGLMDFFEKRSKETPATITATTMPIPTASTTSPIVLCSITPSSLPDSPTSSTGTITSTAAMSVTQLPPPSSSTQQPCTDKTDIGSLLESGIDIRHDLSREEVYNIVISKPNPDPKCYPRTRLQSSGSNRQFQPSWLKLYPWLIYSKQLDGVFCRACAFFAPEKVGGHVPGQFVVRAFSAWVKMSDQIKRHVKLDYHSTSIAKMEEYVARYKHPAMAIDNQYDHTNQQHFEENLKVVESLLSVAMFCGKQGLALRGHRDDSIVWDRNSNDDVLNEGNFIEMVRFRAETDDVLRRHLANSPRNARYTSKTIQNELVDIIGTHIRASILDEVKNAKFFSVIADEVTDTSNSEQVSICLRYVHSETHTIKEVFADFVAVERITGKAISEAILGRLTAWDLQMEDLIGQCYDGSANMSAARAGCRGLVQQHAPQAVYFHCTAHQLNLAIVAACKIPDFRNTEATVGEMARFFSFSAKRQRLLDRALEFLEPESQAKKLKDACRTRWIQRIDAYTVLIELLPTVLMVFQAMTNPVQYPELGTDWSWDNETKTKANGFLHQLESSSFLLSIKILLEVFAHIRVLTLKLQMEALDVTYAYEQIDSVVSELKKMRRSSELEFKAIFEETESLGQSLHGEDFELKLPRITHRQVHRANIPTESTETFYRVSLYNEFISHVVAELEDRFANKPVQIGFSELIPSRCATRNLDDKMPQSLEEVISLYANALPGVPTVRIEYRMWVRKWKGDKTATNKLTDALEQCDSMVFPNLTILLKIALTLPFTSCESERSFSQLKLIKTSLRSTMGSDRLSSLSLMKINRDRCENLRKHHMKDLVRSFAQRNNRRMKLPFILTD